MESPVDLSDIQRYIIFLLTFFSNMQKKLDFTLKVIGGNVSSIPGLSDAIEVQLKFPSNLLICLLSFNLLTCPLLCYYLCFSLLRPFQSMLPKFHMCCSFTWFCLKI